jgi:hypothetical protein
MQQILQIITNIRRWIRSQTRPVSKESVLLVRVLVSKLAKVQYTS